MTDNILHRAEESGQSRELTVKEVVAYGVMSGLKGLILGLAGSTAFSALRALTGDLGLADVGLSFLGFGAMSTAWHLLADLDDMKDGLRSRRSIETFAPPQPEPQAEPPHPPILVRPYGGESYTLGNPALPDRQEALQLTPPVVAEILRASLEEYGGKWSRRKLMALRVSGQKVTRGMYEELTAWLTRAGVLQQERQGGFTLPDNVSEFEDLRRYFPNLPGLGGPGGNRAGRERGPSQVSHPQSGEVRTLAERRKQRWLECGRDVELYMGGAK